MIAEPAQQRSASLLEGTGPRGSAAVLEVLAEAAVAGAGDASSTVALQRLVDGVAHALAADVVVVRVLDVETGEYEARAVAAAPALAAELAGTRVEAVVSQVGVIDELEHAPEHLRRAATRVATRGVLVLPIAIGERTVGTLELLRGARFDDADRDAARLVAAQVGLVLRAFGLERRREAHGAAAPSLELVGQALELGDDGAGRADDIVRLAAAISGAETVALWEQREDDIAVGAWSGRSLEPDEVELLRTIAASALTEAAAAEEIDSKLVPNGVARVVVLPLGRPALGVLQLLFRRRADGSQPTLHALSTFSVRAAAALRAASRARELGDELARTRALLAVVGQATAELSLAHALETAVERVAELLAVDRVAVYLREQSRLIPAAGRGLTGPHVRVAERLLELALGPLRSRGVLTFDNIAAHTVLANVVDAAGEADIESAIAVPLIAHEETIGLLAAYPHRRRRLAANEIELFAALAGQLAVAVQNARLHEQAKGLGEELEAALAAERHAARQLGALYEISRSFAQSLSLEATLDAVTRTVVEVLEIDAAVLALPDERREQLVPRALHVREPQLAAAAAAVFDRPLPFGARPLQRLFRQRIPVQLDERSAAQVADVLRPFIARGWSGAIVPVATPAEVIAALSIFSFHPDVRISRETVSAAVAIAGQAALAIDNARLYQQQKQFADTMQRSLLPRTHPQLAGLEIGELYEPASRVEVGGDVYDFAELPDGRLAVVLGDVTGHGIEATADMAMAKFVFRSLTREHPEPHDFLAAANQVVVSEIAPGKFITMVYVTVDGATGAIVCAGAGHPPPRILRPDGTVEPLDVAGLVLGVDPDQEYVEATATLPVGGALVLYTDGVIEARRDGELYGIDRLDAALAASVELPAAELARAVVADCRVFAGGELADDCAVVVVKRS